MTAEPLAPPAADAGPLPWDASLLDPLTQELAERAAAVAGLTLEDWLERAIRRACAEPENAAIELPAAPAPTPAYARPRRRRQLPRAWFVMLGLVLVSAAAFAILAILPATTPRTATEIAVTVAVPASTPNLLPLPPRPSETKPPLLAPRPGDGFDTQNRSSEPEPTDPGKLALWLAPRALAGDHVAQYRLGALYVFGKGVAQDYGKAATLFLAAARSGLAEAQYDYAVMCGAGLGVPRDYAQAVLWYTKAAEQGYGEASLSLGYAYAKGQGVARDMGEATRWFRRAAELGVVDAQYNLAFLYERGDGLPQDLVEAYAWYQAAAGRGDRSSQESAERIARERFDAETLKRAKARAAEVEKSLKSTPPSGPVLR